MKAILENIFQEKLLNQKDPAYIFHPPSFLSDVVGHQPFGIILPSISFYYQIIVVCMDYNIEKIIIMIHLLFLSLRVYNHFLFLSTSYS